MSILQSGRLEEMYNLDQLYQQRVLGNVFAGYKESRPLFWPTYKYVVGGSTAGEYACHTYE